LEFRILIRGVQYADFGTIPWKQPSPNDRVPIAGTKKCKHIFPNFIDEGRSDSNCCTDRMFPNLICAGKDYGFCNGSLQAGIPKHDGRAITLWLLAQ